MLKVKFFRETDFIERIKVNDRSVLGELFMLYERMIFSYITTHGGSQADAEDMLQEAIIVLWQKVCSGNFELTSKLGTYLLAIAKNKWRAEMRKRKRYSLDGDLALPEKADETPSLLDVLLEDERRETVRRALENIGADCQKLLRLFYFEERSMRDIAELMDFAGEDVAKSKKYQCKKALEEALKKLLIEIEGGR